MVVPDLEPSREADLYLIRGILGVNFLRHFDLLIDYEHSILCLDDKVVMMQEAKGERIALVTPAQTPDEVSLARLVIAVHLSQVGIQQLLLKLDSGTNGPLLYDPRQIFGCWFVYGYFRARPWRRWSGADIQD